MNQGMPLAGFLLLLLLPRPLPAAESYSFDLSEYEKKRFTWGGHLEAKGESFDLNHDEATFAILNHFREPRSSHARGSSTLQLDGHFEQGNTVLTALIKGSAAGDQIGAEEDLQLYAGYASIKLSPQLTLDLGKKSRKWGKGYAWNPVAFIDRNKDPDNPEEAMEGFIAAEADLVKSMDGALRTLALTTVALPVWSGINQDFGAAKQLNLAARLYLLYRDTDLDFLYYTGDSRTTRYGFDFSQNLAANFELHGEIAHAPSQPRKLLAASGRLLSQTISDTSYLVGFRYLTARDITAIGEYYHHGAGFTTEEETSFYRGVAHGAALQPSGEGELLLQNYSNIAASGYGRPQSGQDYLYARLTAKEPWDLLYFAPGVTAIVQLNEQSYSLSPELLYTGFTNLELRAKFTYLNGAKWTEYAEKQYLSKFEIRLRYFF